MSSSSSVSSSSPLLLQWSPERWRLLVLASADVVLEAREKRLTQKEQLASAQVIQGAALQLQLQQARSARSDFADHARFMGGVRKRMAGSAEALSCLDAAVATCQVIPVGTSATSPTRCVLTASTEAVQMVTLVGNRGGRFESTYALSPDALELVQLCAVVGNVHEWLDQQVDCALRDQRYLSRPDELNRLVQTVQPCIDGFHRAAVALYSLVMGPLPQTLEEARKEALRVWETQTDLRELLATAHEVLWPDEQERWEAAVSLDTPKAIRRAYKKLVTIVHPDKQLMANEQRQQETERMFRTLQKASAACHHRPLSVPVSPSHVRLCRRRRHHHGSWIHDALADAPTRVRATVDRRRCLQCQSAQRRLHQPAPVSHIFIYVPSCCCCCGLLLCRRRCRSAAHSLHVGTRTPRPPATALSRHVQYRFRFRDGARASRGEQAVDPEHDGEQPRVLQGHDRGLSDGPPEAICCCSNGCSCSHHRGGEAETGQYRPGSATLSRSRCHGDTHGG